VTDDLKKYRRKTQATDFLISFFRTLILIGLSFVILYPIIYMISCSFRERSDMNDPTVMWIPRNFTLDIIKETIEAMNFGETLYNTLVLNIGCCIVQVMSCAVTGYGFARFKFRGKKLMLGILIFMILVAVQVISLPLYTQFRYFGIKGIFSVNLIDTFACMYLPALLGNGIRSGLIILIFMQFFKGLPKELEDAACLDGCSPFGAFIRVMLPNSISFIITAFLFSIVFYWNDSYVSSTFFTNNQTIGLMLKNLDSHLSMMLFNDASVQISPREQIVWMQAGCLISIAPLLILYCYLQKYFTESIVNSGIVS
jgi:multiple sugar transport system permease protein